MNTTEDSSLHALRELREIEKRRLRQEEAVLGRELESARSEIVHLRGEIERARLGQAQASVEKPRWSHHARSAGWLGITAGATMLMGALALAVATGSKDPSRPIAETSTMPSLACPVTSALAPAEPKPALGVAAVEPSVPKHTPRPRPPSGGRPHVAVKPPGGATCDFATDPLCGIPTQVMDDVGKRPRKR